MSSDGLYRNRAPPALCHTRSPVAMFSANMLPSRVSSSPRRGSVSSAQNTLSPPTARLSAARAASTRHSSSPVRRCTHSTCGPLLPTR